MELHVGACRGDADRRLAAERDAPRGAFDDGCAGLARRGAQLRVEHRARHVEARRIGARLAERARPASAVSIIRQEAAVVDDVEDAQEREELARARGQRFGEPRT